MLFVGYDFVGMLIVFSVFSMFELLIWLGLFVFGNYFMMFGVELYCGCFFELCEDDVLGVFFVVVVYYDFWFEEFGC